MGIRNGNLHAARAAKNDEFYTQYEDIAKEVVHYDLRGMSVYSPCDDYRWSNFKKYFVEHFEELGITKYCCTNYDIGDGAWKYEYDGVNEVVTKLDGDGSFLSDECSEIRDAYDVVITNPPFSKFRVFMKWLEGDKDVEYDIFRFCR